MRKLSELTDTTENSEIVLEATRSVNNLKRLECDLNRELKREDSEMEDIEGQLALISAECEKMEVDIKDSETELDEIHT